MADDKEALDPLFIKTEKREIKEKPKNKFKTLLEKMKNRTRKRKKMVIILSFLIMISLIIFLALTIPVKKIEMAVNIHCSSPENSGSDYSVLKFNLSQNVFSILTGNMNYIYLQINETEKNFSFIFGSLSGRVDKDSIVLDHISYSLLVDGNNYPIKITNFIAKDGKGKLNATSAGLSAICDFVYN